MGAVVLEGKGLLGLEERILRAEALARGLDVTVVGRSARSWAELRGAVLAYGGVRWTRDAFKHAGVPLPLHDPYPAAASFALGRRVWREERLSTALMQNRPVFIKPADGWKRFAGFVADSLTEVQDIRFQGYSKARPVWCSEPMDLVAEYRAYVLGDEVWDAQPAPGTSSMRRAPICS